MQFILKRIYYPESTIGGIFLGSERLSFSLELPWLDNQSGVSCIPEGEYELLKRHSDKHGWHLHLQGTGKRKLILIHEANYISQLRGCIAPVTTIENSKTGWRSGIAVDKIEKLAFAAIERGEKVTLKIIKQ